MVLVFCTSYYDDLFVRNFMKISKTVFNLQSGHKYMVEMAMLNISKSRQIRVRYMSSARRIIEL